MMYFGEVVVQLPGETHESQILSNQIDAKAQGRKKTKSFSLRLRVIASDGVIVILPGQCRFYLLLEKCLGAGGNAGGIDAQVGPQPDWGPAR